MPKKEQKEKFDKTETITENFTELLSRFTLPSEEKEELILELDKAYSIKVDSFKDDYHTYQQSGRFVSSTRLREIKRKDFICFVNLETDVIVIERVQGSDGINVYSNTYEYPLSLTKTIILRTSLNPMKKRTVIHLCIANVSSLEIASEMKNLVNSVFLRNLLKYEDSKGALEKPLTQIIIGGLVFGLVLYFALIQVFKKAIIHMLGQFEITPSG